MTVTRLDPQGNEKWTSRFASYNGSILGTTSCILELDNGGFLVNYKRWELTGFYKYPPILVWLDSLGSVTGQHDFSDFTELIVTDLIKTSDGLIVGCGYADLRPPVMGTTDYGFAGWVFAFTQEGEKLWERYIVDLYYPDKFSYFSGLEETADKGFILTGGIQVPGAMHDIWLVKLDSMGCLLPDECAEGLNVLTDVEDIVNEGQTGFRVFPNPVSQGMLYIEGLGNGYGNSDLEISVSDIAGHVVKKLPFEGQLDVSDLGKGIYFLVVESGRNKLCIEKIIIL